MVDFNNNEVWENYKPMFPPFSETQKCFFYLTTFAFNFFSPLLAFYLMIKVANASFGWYSFWYNVI